MKLIKILGSKHFDGVSNRYGVFECEVCGKIIEWKLWSGLRKKSCGCARIKHDSVKSSRLCRVWRCMKFRCLDKKSPSYYRYGGRGITIYDKWFDFYVFKKWAFTNGYEVGLTIDRKDNDRNYDPGNCQFLTGYENNLKKSTTVLNIEMASEIRRVYNESDVIQTELSKKYGVSNRQISCIICNKTWVDENYIRKVRRTSGITPWVKSH